MANPSDAPTVDGDDGNAAAEPKTPGTTDAMREITVGVDEFAEGFNPHLASDVSPVTDLVAAMTLPSPFMPSPQQPAGLHMNADLLDSATPMDNDDSPTHVRYVIRKGAQWSDGTPISGADFRFLHTKLTTSPGTIRSAAYDAIKNISVADGGRQVDVEFTEPTAEWKSLFQNLLPSHLVGSSTDGFNSVLSSTIPASGSRYTVQSIDVGRNTIRLVRNDRFWGANPAEIEGLTLRAVRSSVSGAEQLRSHQLQAVQVRPQETDALTYGLVPEVSEFLHDAPRTLSLTANFASPVLNDVAARRFIFSHIDVDQLKSVATGRSSGAGVAARPDNSSGSAKVSPSSAPHEPVSDAIASQVSDLHPLRIGVLGSGTQVRAAANAAADQLTAAGVPTVVKSISALELTRTSLPYGQVDLVMSWGDTVRTMSQARNRYLCPSTSVPSLAPKGSSSSDNLSATPTSAEHSAEAAASEGAVASSSDTAQAEPHDKVDKSKSAAKLKFVAQKSIARTGNLSGVCDSDLDALLKPSRKDVPDEARTLIEQHAIELPIVEDTVLTAIGPGVTQRSQPDPGAWPAEPYIGKLMSLPTWQRVLAPGEKSEKNSEGK